MSDESVDEILNSCKEFFDAWCERRCVFALKRMLTGWPLGNTLTDGYGDLMVALQNVRAFAKSELTENELLKLDSTINSLHKLVYREK